MLHWFRPRSREGFTTVPVCDLPDFDMQTPVSSTRDPVVPGAVEVQLHPIHGMTPPLEPDNPPPHAPLTEVIVHAAKRQRLWYVVVAVVVMLILGAAAGITAWRLTQGGGGIPEPLVSDPVFLNTSRLTAEEQSMAASFIAAAKAGNACQGVWPSFYLRAYVCTSLTEQPWCLQCAMCQLSARTCVYAANTTGDVACDASAGRSAFCASPTPVCANLASDPSHCGACNTTCADCVNGACVVPLSSSSSSSSSTASAYSSSSTGSVSSSTAEQSSTADVSSSTAPADASSSSSTGGSNVTCATDLAYCVSQLDCVPLNTTLNCGACDASCNPISGGYSFCQLPQRACKSVCYPGNYQCDYPWDPRPNVDCYCWW